MSRPMMGAIPTPMMPAPDPEPAAVPDVPSLATALRAWERGDDREVDVAALTDLSRDDARLLAERWPALSDETRVRIARRVLEAAEERAELHFGRALRTILGDPSPVVRQFVVAALWEDEGPDLPDVLLRVIAEDASQDVAAQAALSLARSAERAVSGLLGNPEADRLREELLGLAADPAVPPLVRRRALESGAVFTEDERVGQLIAAFFDADEPGFRASALYAMGRTADRRWLSMVTGEFADEDAELRYEAARAAGEIGNSETLTGLAELAGDEDAEVRQTAIAAIGRIGGRSAVRSLQQLADEAPESDADAIEDAMLEAETALDPLMADR